MKAAATHVLSRVSRAAVPRPLPGDHAGASGHRVCSATCSASADHVGFIRHVAAIQPPEYLSQLLQMLQVRGESIVSPGARKGMIPLAIPLSKSSSGAVTALLRWPTAPSGMEMPVVQVHEQGVYLLAKNVSQFIHRMLVVEDALCSLDTSKKLYRASADAGEKLYTMGDFSNSQISTLDVYLLKKVGLFPDILEDKAMHHFERGDHVSALVMAEFYTKKGNFPGFARPFVFNAEILLKVGRCVEAKDAAKGALKLPWWTLGCKYQDVAKIAEWEDEQIEHIKKKVTEQGRQEDTMKGKPPTQIALDEAAFLLDLASVEGTWDDSIESIAKCYEEAGLRNIAEFVRCRY